MTGGGLTWRLRQRTDAQAGTAEIWQAVAPAVLTNATIQATRSSGAYLGSLTVATFIGASTTVDGATAGANAVSGAPSASLVTTAPGSWVWGAGNDWDQAQSRTVGSGQTKVDEYLATTTGDTFWVQRQTATTPNAGTTVTINDTAPTTDRYNLALIEIPASVATPTATPTATSQATATATAIATMTSTPSPTRTPTATATPTSTESPAGIRLVQSAVNGHEGGDPSMSVSFPSSNSPGDFLIVTGSAARPASTLTISDSLGNAYVPAIGPVTDPNQDVTIYVWYVPIAKGGANTITITPPATAALEIHASEWSGLASVSPVDQTASATGNGTNISSGARTTTTNGELIFGYGWVWNMASAGAGFQPITLVNGDLDEYQVQSTAGTIAATFTQSSGTWFALMVTFRPAG